MRDVSGRYKTPQAPAGEGASSSADRRQRRCVRLRWAAWLILLVGLSVSICLFLTATEEANDVVAYVMVDGQSYPVLAGDSKVYRHQIERFGGKMAVFADDLGRWLRHLTSGRGLAALVALMSVVASGVCLRAAQAGTKPVTAETLAPMSGRRESEP